MSHSSNLMTIDAMTQCLADLKQYITSGEITVSDYLSIFDIFTDIEELKESISNLRLIVEVEKAQQGDLFNVRVEEIVPTLRVLFDTDAMSVSHRDPLSWEESNWDGVSLHSEKLSQKAKLPKRGL